MENGRKLRRTGVLAAIAVCVFGVAVMVSAQADAAKPPRPDVIRIAIGDAAQREMPPALFKHDSHTRDLAKVGKDCTVCHADLQGASPFAYVPERKGPAGKGPADAKTFAAQQNAFHKSCIGCHADMEARSQKTGPLDGECRVCHSDRPVAVETLPVNMDKSLHAVHVNSPFIVSPDDPAANCGVCHHSYDTVLKKLVWERGTEQACSVCHGPAAVGSTPSLKNAMHDSCVKCHADMTLTARAAMSKSDDGKTADSKPANDHKDKKDRKGKKDKGPQGLPVPADLKTGPETCAGCHSAAGQAAFPRLENPPRLLRGQPDATVLLPVGNAQVDAASTFKGETRQPLGSAASGMNPVLFNHKSHEAATDSCSVCHHVRIDNGGCSTCHTVEGRPEGKFVQLGKAMHDPSAPQSCVGCHMRVTTTDPTCAGCHIAVKPMAQSSCASCHKPVEGLPSSAIADGSAFSLGKKELESLAVRNLDAQKRVKPLSPNDVPETVIIGTLSKEYEPSVFPHRAIYKALVDGTSASAMASAFHTSPLSTCAACHHHSPLETLATPPKCASCHGTDTQPVSGNRPSLKVAYHQQCMACHSAMKMEKPAATDCTACHAARK